MARSDWLKEITAECGDHFNVTSYDYKIEEDDVDTASWDLWGEFRILGPNVEKLQGINNVSCVINILLM